MVNFQPFLPSTPLPDPSYLWFWVLFLTFSIVSAFRVLPSFIWFTASFHSDFWIHNPLVSSTQMSSVFIPQQGHILNLFTTQICFTSWMENPEIPLFSLSILPSVFLSSLLKPSSCPGHLLHHLGLGIIASAAFWTHSSVISIQYHL